MDTGWVQDFSFSEYRPQNHPRRVTPCWVMLPLLPRSLSPCDPTYSVPFHVKYCCVCVWVCECVYTCVFVLLQSEGKSSSGKRRRGRREAGGFGVRGFRSIVQWLGHCYLEVGWGRQPEIPGGGMRVKVKLMGSLQPLSRAALEHPSPFPPPPSPNPRAVCVYSDAQKFQIW